MTEVADGRLVIMRQIHLSSPADTEEASVPGTAKERADNETVYRPQGCSGMVGFSLSDDRKSKGQLQLQ